MSNEEGATSVAEGGRCAADRLRPRTPLPCLGPFDSVEHASIAHIAASPLLRRTAGRDTRRTGGVSGVCRGAAQTQVAALAAAKSGEDRTIALGAARDAFWKLMVQRDAIEFPELGRGRHLVWGARGG